MEIIKTLKELYDKLSDYAFEPEAEAALGDYLLQLREQDHLLCLAQTYHDEIFEQEKYTLAQQEELGEEQGEQMGMLFAAMFLARYELLEQVYARRNIPGKYKQGALMLYKSLLKKSKDFYGSYGLRGMYRSECSRFLRPDKYVLGRLTFEMTRFNPPYYAVYRDRETGNSVPVAQPGFFYMPNGRQKTNDYQGELFEPYLKQTGNLLECFTFDEKLGYLLPDAITLDLNRYEIALQAGDDILSVHIPENGPMTPELVDEAFAIAEEFFPAYYPEKKFKAYICSSWLLNTDLQKLLNPASNILRYQERFRIVVTSTNWYSIYWHIFGIQQFIPHEQLQPKNRFQQTFLDWVRAGNTLYNGNGYILK